MAILLVYVFTRYAANTDKRLSNVIRNFIVCTTSIAVIYLLMDYVLLYRGEHATYAILRIIDIFAFILQAYFLTEYMREKSGLDIESKEKQHKAAVATAIFCLIIAFISYGFLMEGYYLAEQGAQRAAVIIIEIIINLSMLFLICHSLIKAMPKITEKDIKILIFIISVTAVINFVWNGILTLFLITDSLKIIKAIVDDLTGIYLFVINICTIILIYREDFTSAFRAGQLDDSQGNMGYENIEDRLKAVSENYNLTERESEVMELAYKGFTNPQIAEQLYISKNTVKIYMHNILEKLDISTRTELIHFINNENRPGGLL